MLKSASSLSQTRQRAKNGSQKPAFVSPLASGLNRRAFLQQSGMTVLLASIAGCKPDRPQNRHQPIKATKPLETASLKNKSFLSEAYPFDQHQKDSIAAVQIQLFPADGDGPSAKDINALNYLEWALTDPDNKIDGDGGSIAQGVGWLDGLSEQTQGNQFIKLSSEKQQKILTQISQSSAGENWLSLLIYYLLEALLLDPVYGGNPDGIGWKWIKHQAGFPRPTAATNYRNFD